MFEFVLWAHKLSSEHWHCSSLEAQYQSTEEWHKVNNLFITCFCGNTLKNIIFLINCLFHNFLHFKTVVLQTTLLKSFWCSKNIISLCHIEFAIFKNKFHVSFTERHADIVKYYTLTVWINKWDSKVGIWYNGWVWTFG